MTGKPSRIGFGRAGGASSPSTAVGYQVLSGGMDNSIQRNNSEAEEKLKSRSASAVLSDLGVNITTNTIATAATFKSRIATANGNLSASVTANTTGWFEDITHSDTLADGDLIDVAINCGTITGAFVCRGGAATLTSASGGAHTYYQNNGAAGGPPNLMGLGVNVTAYMALGGQWNSQGTSDNETTESLRSKSTVRAAGTWSNLQAYNASPVSCTVRSRLNGSNGAQSVSVAGSTGLFEDNTHTDTLVAGDTANYAIATNAGSFNNITFVGSKIASNDGKSDVVSSVVTLGTACSNAVTYYGPYGYYHTAHAETVEANAQISCPYTAQFSNLRCGMSSNSLGSDLTFSFRANGGAGSQSVSLTHGTTGVFEDTTHSDTLSAAQKYCYSLSSPGATSGVVLSWFAATQQTAVAQDISIGLALETDTAFPLAPTQSAGLGLAIETDTAFALDANIGVQFLIEETDIIKLEPIALPASLIPTPQAVELVAAFNWTPLTDIAGSVTGAAREALAGTGRVVRLTSGDIADRQLPAKTYRLSSLYRFEADANARAAQLKRWFESKLKAYRLTINRFRNQVELGHIGRIDTYPRFGLEGGFTGVVVAWREVPAVGQVEIVLLGPSPS